MNDVTFEISWIKSFWNSINSKTDLRYYGGSGLQQPTFTQLILNIAFYSLLCSYLSFFFLFPFWITRPNSLGKPLDFLKYISALNWIELEIRAVGFDVVDASSSSGRKETRNTMSRLYKKERKANNQITF